MILETPLDALIAEVAEVLDIPVVSGDPRYVSHVLEAVSRLPQQFRRAAVEP